MKDKKSLLRSYYIIQNDIKKVFEYIEPCQSNFKTHSHRLYEIFLRTCTEVENNLKILCTEKKLSCKNMPDYYKLESITNISKYKLKIELTKTPLELKPFLAWKKSYTLEWYKSYNNIKHDREGHFKEANLENTLNALAGLVALLHIQFGSEIYSLYSGTSMCMVDGTNKETTINEFLFSEINW